MDVRPGQESRSCVLKKANDLYPSSSASNVTAQGSRPSSWAQVTDGGSCELTLPYRDRPFTVFGARAAPGRASCVATDVVFSSAPNPVVVDSVRPDPGADIYMPDLFEPASHFAVTAVWIAAAVAIAYVVGLGSSWTVQRVSRRSAVLRDIAHLTRRSVRATLMVIAASAAVHRFSDPESSCAAGSTTRWSSC